MGPLVKVVSKITSKNQVTVPRSIREVLKVNSGDSIEWTVGISGNVTVKNTNYNLWDIVKRQQVVYGSVDTSEIEWGTRYRRLGLIAI